MIKSSYFNKIKNKFSFVQKSDFIFLFFFIIAFYLIYNLYVLQVINGDYYNDKVLAQNNNYSNSKIFYRGNIYFQDGKNKEIPVAIQRYGWTLAIVPKNIKNPQKTFKILSKAIKLDKEDFIKKASKKNDPYEEIQTKLSDEEIYKIRKLDLKGISLVRENWRFYPFGSLASKVLGFLDVNRKGVYGLEKSYEDILKRDLDKEDRNVFWKIFSDDKTRELFSQKNISKEGDIISSIDISIQKKTEEVLKEIDKKYKSKYSAAIIMKSETGEIVAMADTKNFDLNQKKQDFRNEFLEYVFEVGSVLKPLVVSIGLEDKAINMNFSYNDKGCLKIQKYSVCNYDKRARGRGTDLYKIIAQSLNLGMIEVERKIGHRNLLKGFIDLGLSEETGIDLSGEVPSNISSLNQDIEINYSTASFGQGVAFTPLGILRALNTIASDGLLVEPHLIKEIRYGDLIPSKIFSGERKKVFSPETIKNIKDILIRRSATSSLEKKYARVGYSVAAKTGTAQIPAKNGGYEKYSRNHFFFGFFPAKGKVEDRYSILLFTIRPQGVRYSSTTLTEPFYKIANFIISHKNIKPDRPNLEF